MGLSNAISGAIGLSLVLIIIAIIPIIADNFFQIQNAKSQIIEIDDKESKTKLQFLNNIHTTAGNRFVNFTIKNIGTEKLWDFKNFDLIISYDADIAGSKNKVTDVLTYVSGGFKGTESIDIDRAEFKIQRGTAIIAANAINATLVEGVDFEMCTGDCFVKQISSRFSGMGRTSGGANHNLDDFTTFISYDGGLTNAGDDINFTRHSTENRDDRISWEIWEYVGNAGGSNEMKVLDTGVCTFGITPLDLFCIGDSVPTSPSDDNDVVVFVTGMANPDTGRNDIESCLVTSDWDDLLDRPFFTRGAVGNDGTADACDVSYAVVEWSGANWNVQRIEHKFTDAEVSPSQNEIISSVADISKAFFHTQQRNGPSDDIRDVCHSGTEVQLTTPTTLTYRIPYQNNDVGWTTSVDMDAVTWIVSNLENDDGEKMIVNHYNPPEHKKNNDREDNWQIGINPLTYHISEAAITGLSVQADKCNTSYPQSFVNARLNSSSTVEFWQSDPGANIEYTFQVTEFPHIQQIEIVLCNQDSILGPKKWMIGNVTNDNMDPNILNFGETMHICAQLSNPIWSVSTIDVYLTTNDGYTVNATRVIP